MSNTLDYAFFYPSQNKDRVYNATSFEYWLKKFFTTGVFEGELQVTANDDMTVTIASGYCNIDGKVRFFQNATILQLETANATYNRIDTVIAERNDTDRNITIKVVTGGYATEPLPTAPIRESGVHQLVLAQIYVAAGAVMITQEEITDTRTDQDLCGVVTGTVKEYNFDQFKAQFDKWFASVKDTLSEDAAGNLLKLMGELDSLETDAKDSLVSAINEVFNMAPETVDPMVTTESGFAADALATKNAIDEQNKNLGGFTPVIDEETGEITGYTTTIGGADTVFPFISNMSKLFSNYSFNSTNNVLNFNISAYSKIKYTCTSKVSTADINPFGVAKTVNGAGGSYMRLGEATGTYEVDVSAYKYLFIDVGYTSFPKFSEFRLIE